MAATVDDPKQRRPDISLAGREIGWMPQVREIYFILSLSVPPLSLTHYLSLCSPPPLSLSLFLYLSHSLNSISHLFHYCSYLCLCQVSVSDGLARTIQYFKEELKRNNNNVQATGPQPSRPQVVVTGLAVTA